MCNYSTEIDLTQGMVAMFHFLGSVYDELASTGFESSDLAAIVSGIQLAPVGGTLRPGDDAMRCDWLEAVASETSTEIAVVPFGVDPEGIQITVPEAYASMIRFLEKFEKEFNFKEIPICFEQLKLPYGRDALSDPAVAQRWNQAVGEAKAEILSP